MHLEQLVECPFVNGTPDVDTWRTWLRRTCKENDFESFRELICGDETLVSSPDKRGPPLCFMLVSIVVRK